MDLFIFITGLFVVGGGIVLLLSIIKHITTVDSNERSVTRDNKRNTK